MKQMLILVFGCLLLACEPAVPPIVTAHIDWRKKRADRTWDSCWQTTDTIYCLTVMAPDSLDPDPLQACGWSSIEKFPRKFGWELPR